MANPKIRLNFETAVSFTNNQPVLIETAILPYITIVTRIMLTYLALSSYLEFSMAILKLDLKRAPDRSTLFGLQWLYFFKILFGCNIIFCAYPLRYISPRGNTYSRNTTWKFTLCFRKVAWWWCDDGWNWGWWCCRGVRLVESYYLANRINPTKSSLLGLATHKDKSSKSLQNCNIKSQTKSRDSTLILTISSIHFRLKSIRPDHVRPISK